MKLTMALSALIFLGACSSNSGNSTPTAPTGLSDGIMNEAKATNEYSPAVAAFMKRQSQKSAPVLPDVSLVLPSDNSDQNKSVGVLNQEGLMWLNKIKTDCSITPQNHSQPGAQGTASVTESISGAACPISYTKTTTTTNNFAQSGSTMSGTADVVMTLNQRVMDAQLVQSSGSLQMNGQMNMHMQIFNATQNGDGTSSATATADFDMATTEKTAHMSMKMEVLASRGMMKLALVAHITTNEGALALSMIADNSNMQYFIGGQPATAQQFQEIFGAGSVINPTLTSN